MEFIYGALSIFGKRFEQEEFIEIHRDRSKS
jgi:hypothetical protein